MSNTVLFHVKKQGVKEAPARFHQAACRALGKILELARQIATDMAPGLTGRLKGGRGGYGGITSRVEEKGHKIKGILGASAKNPETGHDYAADVHEGTGLWGPKKRRIVPKNKKVMVWPKVPWTPWPKNKVGWKIARKKFVFARSTKGQKPQPFLVWGLEGAQRRAQQIFNQEVEKIEVSHEL